MVTAPAKRVGQYGRRRPRPPVAHTAGRTDPRAPEGEATPPRLSPQLPACPTAQSPRAQSPRAHSPRRRVAPVPAAPLSPTPHAPHPLRLEGPPRTACGTRPPSARSTAMVDEGPPREQRASGALRVVHPPQGCRGHRILHASAREPPRHSGHRGCTEKAKETTGRARIDGDMVAPEGLEERKRWAHGDVPAQVKSVCPYEFARQNPSFCWLLCAASVPSVPLWFSGGWSYPRPVDTSERYPALRSA